MDLTYCRFADEGRRSRLDPKSGQLKDDIVREARIATMAAASINFLRFGIDGESFPVFQRILQERGLTLVTNLPAPRDAIRRAAGKIAEQRWG